MAEEVTSESQDSNKSFLKSTLPFLGVIIVAAIAFGAFLFLSPESDEESQSEVTLEEQQQGEPNYTIEEVPFSIADIAPNANRGIAFGETIPEKVQDMLETQAEPIRARLIEDVTRADDWFNLALIYHTANDFEGARDVWEFLIQVLPESTVAYDNLGNLYHLSLKDFPKSESYFNQSLGINAANINAYLGLLELYRYSYKTETNAAVDIMNRAIAQFPDRLDLILTLGTYYKERENYTEARRVLEDGLDKARDAANVDMIAAFGTEIERLPQ